MYCAPLVVEGFGQEDPPKVRDEIIMELVMYSEGMTRSWTSSQFPAWMPRAVL